MQPQYQPSNLSSEHLILLFLKHKYQLAKKKGI